MTIDDVRELKRNRRALKQNIYCRDLFECYIIKRGCSCEPEDYHISLKQTALMSLDDAPVTNNTCLVIESDQECRPAKLQRDGNIEAGVGMNSDLIRTSI